MQTFLPYADFRETAKCLDYKRLGKQRVEAYQIIKNLCDKPDRWQNHPAVKMWKGYLQALTEYYNVMLEEWERRGYRNIKLQKMVVYEDEIEYPPFINNKEFHDSHKSNLLRKDLVFYGKYSWNVPDDLPYVWQIIKDKEEKE